MMNWPFYSGEVALATRVAFMRMRGKTAGSYEQDPTQPRRLALSCGRGNAWRYRIAGLSREWVLGVEWK